MRVEYPGTIYPPWHNSRQCPFQPFEMLMLRSCSVGDRRGGADAVVPLAASWQGLLATGPEKVKKGFEPMVVGFWQVPYNDLAAMRAALSPATKDRRDACPTLRFMESRAAGWACWAGCYFRPS
jgi:hypothetical protein